MLRITLSIILLLSATAATTVDAASYQKIDGTIVDPIQSLSGGDHAYSGSNLQPMAMLMPADLSHADLTDANLIDADLTGAELTGSDFSDALNYDYATWLNAFYYTDNEPTWPSGMDAAWRTSEGILALAPVVPEPSTMLLALIGLALLPRKRRRRR